MSSRLISHSADLKRLRDEGYEVEVRGTHLLVRHIPYVNSKKEVRYGTLISDLTVAVDITGAPGDHTASFAGEAPCDSDGNFLAKIIIDSTHRVLAEGVEVDHRFSSKPVPSGVYADYYEKMTTYANIVGGPARSIEPEATATTFAVVEDDDAESVFRYLDTASSRAGISAVAEKLILGKVAIVGLGGTGSYVLDFVAKTLVREIHIFDGDKFLQHSAFRAPGAASVDELREELLKVEFFCRVYSKMHRGVIPHGYFLDSSRVEELREMDFVFLCLDRGQAKKVIIIALEEFGTPFVDVGMGVLQADDGSLFGSLRVTASTPEKREHVWDQRRIGFEDSDVGNEYGQNIQVADLNALNAALAVVKWKKMFGFYTDLEHEHQSVYCIDGNDITNEDKA